MWHHLLRDLSSCEGKKKKKKKNHPHMKHKIRKKSRLYADNSYYVQRKKKDTAML